ncbi:hydrogenase [Pseudoroseomonas deserti]|uniref:Hydrogenase n=1 Tax=Teichococcus deserti TaxID=1817963 RepID=A0A1V2GYL4_9PROT|nr:cytochrome b/b6 domain-containing protein [Pseudoroseomonas deserti]ONG47741.1 hydrogenase [Pseudoroseomonas deserti]
MALVKVKVWDGWVRAGHWLLAGLIGLSWWSAETGRMELHLTSGYLILSYLLFRLAWGFLGSETARFRQFLRSPLAALGHLGHLFRREPDREIGHNAAGGWMVLALLAVLLAQAGSGLFADDDILTRGPLAGFVSGETSYFLTTLHGWTFNLILALVGLHVAVVLLYALAKRQDLVRPMVTGSKRLPEGSIAPRLAPLWLGLLLACASGGIVWWISTLG